MKVNIDTSTIHGDRPPLSGVNNSIYAFLTFDTHVPRPRSAINCSLRV
jgi:hypothetical protein